MYSTTVCSLIEWLVKNGRPKNKISRDIWRSFQNFPRIDQLRTLYFWAHTSAREICSSGIQCPLTFTSEAGVINKLYFLERCCLSTGVFVRKKVTLSRVATNNLWVIRMKHKTNVSKWFYKHHLVMFLSPYWKLIHCIPNCLFT